MSSRVVVDPGAEEVAISELAEDAYAVGSLLVVVSSKTESNTIRKPRITVRGLD